MKVTVSLYQIDDIGHDGNLEKMRVSEGNQCIQHRDYLMGFVYGYNRL